MKFGCGVRSAGFGVRRKNLRFTQVIKLDGCLEVSITQVKDRKPFVLDELPVLSSELQTPNSELQTPNQDTCRSILQVG